LIALVEAITWPEVGPCKHIYGVMQTAERAAAIHEEQQRLDRRMMEQGSPHSKWSEIERDDTRGRALPEHMKRTAKSQGQS